MRRITWLGHATVLLEVAGARLLTDPVLRRHVAHLRRRVPLAPGGLHDALDGVLISHIHHDNLDRPSLRQLARAETVAVVPRGAGRLLHGLPFGAVHELAAGERATVGGAEVRAVPAWHPARRWPRGARLDALGFLTEGVWFAGDTDFDERMEELRGSVEVALVPIWGWGPSLGPGHLDPESAARAVALVAPSVVVPIHWGTFLPFGAGHRHDDVLSAPAQAFAAQVAGVAPGVRVATLAPGETLSL
jgi:L-ascorbate metabolism protein UlaG (beta-lactamase superfamily)